MTTVHSQKKTTACAKGLLTHKIIQNLYNTYMYQIFRAQNKCWVEGEVAVMFLRY